MNRVIKYVIFAVICLILSNELSGQQTDTSFVFKLEINPSFEPAQNYRLVLNNDKCIVNDINYKLKSSDSIIIGYLNNLELVFKNYKFHKLESYSYNKKGEISGIGLDGTSIRGIVQMNNLEQRFNFHSVNIDFDSLQTDMMNTFFNLMFALVEVKEFSKQFSDEKRYYLERMETRCTRNAMRKITDNPLKYKLFERVYNFNYEEVVAVFDSFSKDKAVDVEIGRFFNLNVNDKFYEIFQMDISKRDNINWIVYQNNKEYLLSLGIQEEKIKELKEYLERPD